MLINEDIVISILFTITAITAVSFFIYKRRKKRELIWWLDLFSSVIVFLGSFCICSALAANLSSSIEVIESPKVHNIYWLYGTNEDFLIDIEINKKYVLNKTDKAILVYSYVKGKTQDWEVIQPGQIKEVNHLPRYYFEDVDVSKLKTKSAVIFYQ